MSLLLGFSRAVDAMNARLGRGAAWLIVVAIMVSAINAIVRKLFDTSSNAWLELQWVLFGAAFLTCASWTLAANEHIRIDIVNTMLPRRVRHWIEVVGHALFLLPMAILVVYLSWWFFLLSAPTFSELIGGVGRLLGSLFTFSPSAVGEAWRALLGLGEQSTNAGGLPQWPAKLLIPVCFTLLALQGMSELIKRIAMMQGFLPDDLGSGHHGTAADEVEQLKGGIDTGAAAQNNRAPGSGEKR